MSEAPGDGREDAHEIDDRQLWEWLDQGSPELDLALARSPALAGRVAELRRVLAAFRDDAGAGLATPRELPARVGRYSLRRRIGRGGMGVVFEAEQDSPRRRVALKLLRDAAFDDAEVKKRLAREAEALGRLAHPHVATVLEHGESAEGESYLAMELVDGVPLDQWARERRSRTREIVELLEKVARAVHHAHERGIVHRDLKPSNVLVDARGEPKVLDFGLAHLASSGSSIETALTTSGRIFGTVAYMSPEQARGDAPSDPRSDVYSLGVVLFEALSGRLPYDLSARSLPEALRVIAEAAPARLRSFERGSARELDVITAKALEKEPARRYASAAELADDLRRHLDGRPIRAHAPSLAYRTLRFARRHALALAAAAAILALALFGAFATLTRVDLGSLAEIGGDWYARGSPFDGLRWEGDAPLVRVGETWYELLEIEGLHASYVVGFCKQNAGDLWRKRFREDLLQVLNRLGRWPIRSVDLVVRELESGTVRELADVEFTNAKRDALRSLSSDWYFTATAWTDDGLDLLHDGRRFELVSIDGVAAADLRRAASARSFLGAPDPELDAVFLRAAGRSPHERVDVVLRDPVDGSELRLPDVSRDRRYAGWLTLGPAPAVAREEEQP